jgi:thiamine-monophosphate kinase
MTGSAAGQTGEDEIIARYFRPLAKHPAAFGLIDDCAALPVPTRSPRRPCG